MNIATSFLNCTFQNPTILASGILGVSGASMARMIRLGAGGVTMKSLAMDIRHGHQNPTMIGTDHYILNAVGLSGPGIEEGSKEIDAFKTFSSAPLIGSVFAGTVQGFAEVTKRIDTTPVDIIELDLSCPNVGEEFAEPFAYSVNAVETITKACKAVSTKPISVKLSPNTYNIAELAKTAEASGADAITAVNTLSGMAIDVRARMPILANKRGGISGSALFPVALRCVYDVYETIHIPIIGTGGVSTGEDAIAMIMAGATLVGVGSAVYHRGDDVFQKITTEIEDIMKEEGIVSLDDIRGCAHS